MAGEVQITLYSGPRHFELLDSNTENVELLDSNTENVSLFISSSPNRLWQTDGYSIRVFATRAQFRELRDLLNRAPLGEDQEYDIAYAAAVRQWEAV